MSIDYQAIYKTTTKNHYPLPRIDELLDKVQQVKYFKKLNLKYSYHQAWVGEEDT
jgi:hypothetical protein